MRTLSGISTHAAQRDAPDAGAGAIGANPGVSAGKQRLLMLTPLLLLASMYGVFRGMTALLGPQRGFVAAYLVYWGVWGVAVPLTFLGRDGIAELFRTPRARGPIATAAVLALLALPVLAGFLFVFPSLFADGERVLLLFLVYAVVNGILEEVYWRGLFVRAFPRDVVCGHLYPAAAFGVWHLIVLSMSGPWPPVAPVYAFFLAALLGLLYAWATERTGSIRWVATSHVLLNLSGLGAFIIFQPWP
ncbi:MAG TPA: CPBP family intramembrane glutamic endopeptidase [Gemmatimonadaceae bacterium]|nr:CPBP family intramembrane glutamic endopeptidase [Gemmatimonadaceae bacterium]